MGAVRDVIGNFGIGQGVTPQQYLAGVIQGEASSPAGQFAVASVIYNRTESPTGGFGDNVIETAAQGTGTGVPQFSGYNSNYSPQAYALAGATLDGSLPQYGNTGNALYYNAAGNNSGYDSGGSVIGGNAFSDQYNSAPSSNYVAPQYGGTPFNSSATPGYALGNPNSNDTPPTPQTPLTEGMSSIGTSNDALSNQQDALQNQDYYDPGSNNAGYTPQLPLYAMDQNSGLSAAGATGNNTTDGFAPITGDGASSFAPTVDGGFTPGADNVPDTVSGYSVGSGGSSLSYQNDTTPTPDNGLQSYLSSGDNIANAPTPAAENTPDLSNVQADGAQASSSAAGDMTIPQAIDSLAQTTASDTSASDKSVASAAQATSTASANLGKTFTSLIGQAVKQVQQSTTQQTSTTSQVAAGAESFLGNWFSRGAMILLGVVFVAGALILFFPKTREVIATTARAAA